MMAAAWVPGRDDSSKFHTAVPVVIDKIDCLK